MRVPAFGGPKGFLNHLVLRVGRIFNQVARAAEHEIYDFAVGFGLPRGLGKGPAPAIGMRRNQVRLLNERDLTVRLQRLHFGESPSDSIRPRAVDLLTTP